MTPRWAVRLPLSARSTLARLRRHAEVQVACDQQDCWLRIPELSEGLQQSILALPTGTLFEILEDGQLRAADQLVPDGYLPKLDWRSIRDAVIPAVPSAALSGKLTSEVPLQLVRAAFESESNVLLLPWARFAAWCEEAPAVRLNRCRFAMRSDRMAVLHGLPLPPLDGTRFVESHGIAVPAGYSWEPAVPAQILAQRWELQPHDLCLWFAENGIERIGADEFVFCTRSAVRVTTRAMQRIST